MSASLISEASTKGGVQFMQAIASRAHRKIDWRLTVGWLAQMAWVQRNRSIAGSTANGYSAMTKSCESTMIRVAMSQEQANTCERGAPSVLGLLIAQIAKT
jgi:hypothetical protein